MIRKPGKELIPSPRPGEVVVFEAFFEAGLGLPAVDFLAEVLDLFHVTLPQLSPNAVARLAIFEWALRAEGCEGRAEIFAALHRASCQPKTFVGSGGEKVVVAFGSINFRLRDEYALQFPAKAINARWYTDWVMRWFYAEVGASNPLAGPLKEIQFRKEALVHPGQGQLEARLNLLQRISRRLSMRDLAEEFLGLQISPLMANWPIIFEEDSESGLRKITLTSSPAAPVTSEQIVRASEKILGAPTPTEKEWRIKLVGSWERFNRVWGMLEITPPPLMDWVPSEKGPKKRKAKVGTSSSAKTPVKKVARKPKNLAPSSSRASVSDSKEDEGRLLVRLIEEDETQRTAQAEVPANVPESQDNPEQPRTSAVQEDISQDEVPVNESGVKVTMASIPKEATRTAQDDAPTVQDLTADSDEDLAFDPPNSPMMTPMQNVEESTPMEEVRQEEIIPGPSTTSEPAQRVTQMGLGKGKRHIEPLPTQTVLARAANICNDEEIARLREENNVLQRNLNISESRVAQMDNIVSTERRARQGLEATNKELEAERIVLRAEVEKLRAKHATAGSELVRLQEEASQLLNQKNILTTENARLSGVLGEVTLTKDALNEDKLKSEKVAVEVMNQPRSGDTTGILPSDDNITLLCRLKRIQGVAKQMKTAGIRYGELSGQVVVVGLLCYYEDLGRLITPDAGGGPITFDDERLLTPSEGVAAAWRAFQTSWRAEGHSAIKAWIDEGQRQKQVRTQASSSQPPSNPQV
ncbi:hypothetical protein GUJ93_ZPchr0009g1295 [Zizania palustris]|uniref:Transposase (putative) gypsy type domain-containing protein n=1 Tax=Zizania palustris TaxID=103762 RepID=A0A8J5UZB6_ZIZPA|nr:hypothetical protein GUJ93_ZPchr0009g1295 [Zizania palustris]